MAVMQRRQTTGDMGAAELVRALEDAGLRMTSARRAVADLIASRDGAFETADLVADSNRRRLGVARASIFRTLELLTRIGAVERLDLPDGNHSYVRCDSRVHHHHLVCTRCQRSVDLEGIGMAPIIAEVERQTGYRIDRHRVELFGLCPSCQAATSSQESEAPETAAAGRTPG
jgi:Fur family ferric uptake transcriptional regulator